MDPAAESYALLDAGAGRRLERFGEVVLDRPAPAAPLVPPRDPSTWSRATARYERRPGAAAGTWDPGECRSRNDGRSWSTASRWSCARRRPGRWASSRSTSRSPAGRRRRHEPRRARSGARRRSSTCSPTPASRPWLSPARVPPSSTSTPRGRPWRGPAGTPRGRASPTARIRWLVDDAARFVAREARRGRRYDGVLLDPPTYGHGPDGAAWRLEDGPRPAPRRAAAAPGAGAHVRCLHRPCDRPRPGPAPGRRRGRARPRGHAGRGPRAGARRGERRPAGDGMGGPGGRRRGGGPGERTPPARHPDHERRQPARPGGPGAAQSQGPGGRRPAAGRRGPGGGPRAGRRQPDRRGLRVDRAAGRRRRRPRRPAGGNGRAPGRASAGPPRPGWPTGTGAARWSPSSPCRRATWPISRRPSTEPSTRCWSSSRTPRSRGTWGRSRAAPTVPGAAALIAATSRGPDADPWNPNAVRASVGTILGLPLAVAPTPVVLAWLRERGIRIIAARVQAAAELPRDRPAGPARDRRSAREALGLGPDWLAGGHRRRPAADARPGGLPQRVGGRRDPPLRGAPPARTCAELTEERRSRARRGPDADLDLYSGA